jgi:hypothetical protein
MKLQTIILIWPFIALSLDFQVLSEPAQTENSGRYDCSEVGAAILPSAGKCYKV